MAILKEVGKLIGVMMFLTVTFLLLNKGMGYYNIVSGQIDDKMSAVSQSNLTIYDGLPVSGNDVLSCIVDYGNSESMEVLVKNGAGNFSSYTIKTTTAYSATPAPTLRTTYDRLDQTAINYINPAGTFVGSVHMNSNGVVDYIMFTQK